MTLSETGTWLEHALRTLTADGESVVQLDDDTMYSLVSYCEMAAPADAFEYLLNAVGDAKCKDTAAEYFRRRGGTKSVPDEGIMQPYQKPPRQESWSTGTKKAPKQKSGAVVDGSGNNNASSAQKHHVDHHQSPLLSGYGVLSAENIVQEGKRPVGKGKKHGKGTSLADVSKGLARLQGRVACTCQGTKHQLVNNCLSCGRIVCLQEGEGPCHFCGALVLREGSDYGGLEGLPVPPATDAEIAAEEFKNRLVEYGRAAANRTTVIDDQSDYFEIEGNTWLSEKEKKVLQEKLRDERQSEEDRRKQLVVTIDLLGRKFVVAGQEDGKGSGEGLSILASGVAESRDLPKAPRIKPNPYLTEAPMFVDSRQSTATARSGASEARQSSSRKFTELPRSGRIQHDDPIVEAMTGHSLNDLGSDEAQSSRVWQSPEARARGHEEEEAEKFFDCESVAVVVQDPLRSSTNADASGRLRAKENSKHPSNNSTEWPTFHICLPHETGKSAAVALLPTLQTQKQMERKEALRETNGKSNQPNKVLLPGMILLKKWLSPEKQVEIVNHCRTLGVGPGGFYQPAYDDGAKMHLQMMCLGLQWEPTKKSYGSRRSHYDNALPPSIPDSFARTVEEAVLAARATTIQDSGGQRKGDELVPEMVSKVCIVNFYEHSGNLGMHQDKDESAESLRKGCPVVSFSIGDSAEFAYGQQRDLLSAKKVLLESGDVLIFGGLSRMIFHGITRVISDTSPRWLSQTTNLRPGRLNLTFRQS